MTDPRRVIFMLFITCTVADQNTQYSVQQNTLLLFLDVLYRNICRLIQRVSIPPGIIIRDSCKSKNCIKRSTEHLKIIIVHFVSLSIAYFDPRRIEIPFPPRKNPEIKQLYHRLRFTLSRLRLK